MEKELTGRNKWGFASNCIPRDLTYVLVSLFFLTFIQYTCGFTNQQFIVLSSIIVSSASFIILLNVSCRSSAVDSSPVTI